MLILLFMAVTSSTSAELIAVSSLLTFDVYKTYIKPGSSSHRLVQVSHYGIIIYALVLAAFCSILNAVGINLTWLLTVLGVIVGGGSMPVGLILLWPRMSTPAARAAPWIGLSCGLIAWFVTTHQRSGEIKVATTGDTINAVAGNVTSWGVGLSSGIILSLIFPRKFSSSDPVHIDRANKVNGVSSPKTASPPSESKVMETTDLEKEAVRSSAVDNRGKEDIPGSAQPETYVPTGNALVDYLETSHMQPMDPVAVKKAERLATGANLIFFFIAMILVPFTLFGTQYICELLIAMFDYSRLLLTDHRQPCILYRLGCRIVHLGLEQHVYHSNIPDRGVLRRLGHYQQGADEGFQIPTRPRSEISFGR